LDDLPAILTIERDLFSDPWPESVFYEDIVSGINLPIVAQLDNKVAGYAILTIEGEEGHLTNIAVAPQYQRKSIAKKLLSYILRFATGLKMRQILLEVRTSNKPAVSLYETFGFEHLAVQKSYYQSPVEDCLIMRKDIAEE
jgi:ribosomal-protein-alanine N-acetyltransferase